MHLDDDEFLIGGLHLDFDAKETSLWRTWCNYNEIALPEYWNGWTLRDYHHDYRSFYHWTPRFIEFTDRSELVYVEKIRNWVPNRSLEEYPHDMKVEERERILSDALRRYHEDNPALRSLPGLWQ